MKKEFFLLFGIIAVALLFVFFFFIYSPEVKSEIVIHEADGKSYKIRHTQEGYDDLLKECRDTLSSIDSQLKWGLSYGELKVIKTKNKYVEIVFPETANITTKMKTDEGKYRIIERVEEATFMLSGEHSGIIFTHEKDAHGVGVWESSEYDANKLRKKCGL